MSRQHSNLGDGAKVNLSKSEARNLSLKKFTPIGCDSAPAANVRYIQKVMPDLIVGSGEWVGMGDEEVWVKWRWYLNKSTRAFSIPLEEITTNAILVSDDGLELGGDLTAKFFLRRISRCDEWRIVALMGKKRTRQPIQKIPSRSLVPPKVEPDEDWAAMTLRKSAAMNDIAIFTFVKACCLELGFSGVATSRRNPLDPTHICREINYPTGWQEAYLAKNLILVDPRIKHALQSNEPLIWNCAANSDASQEEQDFWQLARNFGIVSGWSQASADKTYMFIVSREDFAVTANFINGIEPKLKVLAEIMYGVLERKMTNESNLKMASKLTVEDIRILTLIQHGDSIKKIARQINESVPAVESRWARVREKLDAKNKEQAVEVGLALRVISPLQEDTEQ